MPSSSKSPDREAADQYRREAARIRALADASYLTDVRNDLFTIAHDYEVMAERRDDAAPRDESGPDELAFSRGIPNPRRQSGRAR